MSNEQQSEMVKLLLERQAENQSNPPKSEPDTWEPFAWIDPEVKSHMGETMTKEQMEALDKAAKSMFRGKKMMTNAISSILNKTNQE